MKSIQGRLGVWLVGSLLALFGLHWLITTGALRVFTEHYVVGCLEEDGESVLVGLRFDPIDRPVIDDRYTAPIYQRAYSGHYFVIASGGHRVRSRSLWDQDLPSILDKSAEARVQHTMGPLNQPLLVWTDSFEKKGREVSIAVAEDLSALKVRFATFWHRFAVITLLLLGLLVVAQRLIVRMSLKPLIGLKKTASSWRKMKSASCGRMCCLKRGQWLRRPITY